MADLQIAPIRPSRAYHDTQHRSHGAPNILPPLRTLEPQARYNPVPRPATLEPPPDSHRSSFSSTTFQQSRRQTKPSRQPQQSSSKHRSRTEESTPRSSRAGPATPDSRHGSADDRRHKRHHEHERHTEEPMSSHEVAWKGKQATASSPYSSDTAAYPTPVQSTTGCSDLSSEAHASPSSVVQSPIVLASRPASPWRLHICQQPRAARACGFGERDRRVIDPPPIVQLEALDYRGRPLDVSELRNTFSVVHVSLWNETGTEDCTSLVQPGRRPGGRLMGTLVASATVARDQRDQEGIFFAFPDLSCRSYGDYRLRFALMTIDPLSAQLGAAAPVVAYAMSDVFTVYSAKDFPGMRPSTALTQAFKGQGIAIPVKKGKQGFSRGGRDEVEEEEDDEEDDAYEQRPEPSRRRRG